MGSIFSAILAVPSLITGAFGTINSITKALSDEKLALISATTQKDQIASQERIATLTARRDVLIADAAHSNIDLWIRVAFSLGPVSVLLKIFLWDKALGQWTAGHTDSLDVNLWQVIMVEIGFYFLYTGTVTVAKIIKSR